ncbi:acyltransferase [Sphingomonas aliaeris]|uniref:Acyltransferase n=1 Tax=Sphingomonas aliaeris TaxID=2759526 RepID=A0A974S3E2_9SPHN|nr:acyltransferase family protein [Sphingomonas aliaeris]QQV76329.1 acyltransferase [Sphingomonas aliaeris]
MFNFVISGLSTLNVIDSGQRRTRHDIQALRGYAVLVVILYHTNLGLVPFGFLGVDTFFVISGYLITGIISRGIRDGGFSIVDFYLRRAKRLFPATFVTLLVTVTASIFLLTTSAWINFAPQFYGALAFATNVVLWQQINYFKAAAELEPLLHMWSLAVEEQYYFLLPILLRLIPARFWPSMVAVLTVSSLTAYILLYSHSPGAAFYLLPTRAWEIGIGAVVALLPPLKKAIPARGVAAFVAAILLCVIPFAGLGGIPPHLLALPITVGTAAILYADITPRRPMLLQKSLGWLGDRSYSLYLVHWPIFALARNVYLALPLPLWLVLSLLVLTVTLAMTLYSFVEEPLRRSHMSARNVRLMWIAGTSLLAIIGGLGSLYAQSRRPALDLAPVTGLSVAACNSVETPFKGGCVQSKTPKMLIWGDSLSQAITPGMDASTDEPIAQASMGQCAPLLDIAPVDADSPKPYALECIAHNKSVLEYAIKTPSIRVVVLTGAYLRYAQAGTSALRSNGSTAPATFEELAAAQLQTTKALRMAGKRVVLITPPPQAKYSIASCQERALMGLMTRSARPDCALTPGDRQSGESEMQDMFPRILASGTPVIRLDRMVCPNEICRTQIDGQSLYRDGTHLSRSGSILLGRRFGLGSLAWREAR